MNSIHTSWDWLSPLAGQFLSLRRVLLGTFAVGFVVIIGVMAWAQVRGLPFSMLSLDPATSTNSPWYTGVLSNLGILVWASTAAVCLFTSALLRRSDPPGHRFFLWAGLFSVLLTLDDLFMLHEGLSPRLLGVPQWAYIIGYGAMLGAYLVAFRDLVFRSDYLLLALACLFFGVSMSLDLLADTSIISEKALPEDSAKFFGILFWAGYFFIGAARAAARPWPQQ